MKRFLSLALVLLMLAGLAACASTGNTVSETSSAAGTSSAESEVSEEEKFVLFSNLPEINYEGETVRFLVEGDYMDTYKSVEVMPHEASYETLNGAILDRNNLVEERFGVKIEEYRTSSSTEMNNTLTENATAGISEYDVVMPYVPAAAKAAQQGYFVDLASLDGLINKEMPYYDQGCVQGLSIGGKNYFLTGDMTLLASDVTHVLLFNKDVVVDYNLESPYDLVKDGKWTIDKLGEMARTVTAQYDDNPDWTHMDKYGFLVNHNFISSMFIGAGLRFTDKDNNLWMCNTECDTIVRVKKNDGTWKAFYFEEIAGYPTFDYTVFDSRGWAWINSRRSTPYGHHAGVFVFDTNGTLDDTSDDRHKLIGSFTNQDGTPYAPDLFNCITPDLNGAIWFGNSLGLFVSYNPGDVFKQNFYLSQVKVPRNDGTNLADYLLNGVNVKCITIDGGNRKWIGTSGSGVYLISHDGLETIHHFTVDNSPLISNNIYSIAIDGQTGEVFIGTDRGLVSFMGDATEPESEMDDDLLKVYPNPVHPDYQGQITITGLMFNSNVKIVNAAGRLVHEGTSVGGEFTWNGRLSSGKRAASGIYYVLATDEEGNEGATTKFLIVR